MGRRASGLLSLFAFVLAGFVLPLFHLAETEGAHAHHTADGLVVHTHVTVEVERGATVRPDSGHSDSSPQAVFSDLHSTVAAFEVLSRPSVLVSQALVELLAITATQLMLLDLPAPRQARAPPLA